MQHLPVIAVQVAAEAVAVRTTGLKAACGHDDYGAHDEGAQSLLGLQQPAGHHACAGVEEHLPEAGPHLGHAASAAAGQQRQSQLSPEKQLAGV